jgi:prepilin-type N-terminal cleavage/methylation domain-containing protein
MYRSAGFSFIEILLAVALLAVLATVGIPISVSWYRTYQLHSEQLVLAGLLRYARAQAMANVDNADRGVYIGDGVYVVFTGPSYISTDPHNQITAINTSVTTSSDPQTIVFARRSGAATPAVIGMRLANRSLELLVSEEGLVQ